MLVTVATLLAARDSAGQSISAGAQAIGLITRADPTAGRRALTEAYVTQPVAMAHAAWGGWRARTTLDLEGLTLKRGELNTGGYGEGYVDRRHPHAYVHELLVGHEVSRGALAASVFAGRGFAPFGSDDPMMRPFVKYPVNHHLAQVLERVAVIGAAALGPVTAEIGTFNGDEPLGPGSSPNFARIGDSWSGRLTIVPMRDLELGASFAKVASPEVRVGRGLDQHKTSLVARFSRIAPDDRRYAMIEYAATNDRDRGTTITRLRSALAEASLCRRGITIGGRLERTDRPEEEELLDPFRVGRPSSDLHNLGVSRWTTATASVASPRIERGIVSGRPFVEVAAVHAGTGNPAGVFSAEHRYGTRRMWMLSAGIRLRAGMMHDRMGRYGAALRETPTNDMPMDDMAGMHHHNTIDRCSQ